MTITRSRIHLKPFQLGRVSYQAVETTPYGIEMINAPSQWSEAQGNDVVVAVLDTGCDLTHPDLRDRIIGGRNFTSTDSNDYSDSHYHGTHVAGTIAASLNGVGVVGVAPKVKLLILKVLDANGSGSYDSLINAIQYAISWRGPNQEKVRVISMSLGGPNDVPALHDAIKRAVNSGILVVCASGNSGDGSDRTDETTYPGYYNEVVSVGAVDQNQKLAPFSNTNEEIDFVAPGVNVLSTYPGNRLATLSGTSMATPHVSGAAAILIQKAEKESGRTLTEPEIYDLLRENTVSIGLSRNAQGNGLLYLQGGQQSNSGQSKKKKKRTLYI
ncbi:S8 family peptidase [Bacillus oleivorans]|uniref:S8 family peptidase n=1 Tax=Bacillus oleivorans TaxID=1448271 RepID=UPI001FE45243|nr:S8 family peptidase [Bacillus oleivorans]